MSDTSLQPSELRERMTDDPKLIVLDVRRPEEWAFCHLESSTWIPLDKLADRHGELPRDRPIACLCHHGFRSAAARRFLIEQGFGEVYNVTGGIEAWSCEVDPSVPRY